MNPFRIEDESDECWALRRRIRWRFCVEFAGIFRLLTFWWLRGRRSRLVRRPALGTLVILYARRELMQAEG